MLSGCRVFKVGEYKISGRVTEADGEKGIPGVKISYTINKYRQGSTTTNTSGVWFIRADEGDQVTIWAQKDNFMFQPAPYKREVLNLNKFEADDEMQKNQITIVYGENPQEMVADLLAKLKPEEEIPKGATIGLKPNLVLGKPASSGATTHPEMVEGIIRYFLDGGYSRLKIMESSWVGART